MLSLFFNKGEETMQTNKIKAKKTGSKRKSGMKPTQDTTKVMSVEERQYFQKLKNSVEMVGSEKHDILLEKLWHKVFYSSVELDDNRVESALELRSNIVGDDVDLGSVRVFEILVVLTKKFDSDLQGHKSWKGFRACFWEIVENIGLLDYNDKAIYDSENPEEKLFEIDEKLTIFLDRTYKKNGENGGAFPLQKAPKNLQKVELWYQLQYYIVEKKKN